MTTSTETSPDQVMGQIMTELGAGVGVLLTALGVRHGLWAALAGAGPLDAAEVAARTGLIEPYVREWLRAQAAAGYLEYHPGTDAFSLPEPVEIAVLRAPGGATVDACAHMFASMGASFADFEKAFVSGAGFGWHQRDPEYWAGTDALTRCSIDTALLAAAIEDLPGVADALRKGGAVADIGCGYGTPTRMIAEAFGAAKVTGFDYHDRSIAAARAAAADGDGRVRFEVAAATDFPGDGYALVTFVDSLHDLGDPVGALTRARKALAPDGAVLLVEPPGGDRVADNLNPAGRMFYAVSFLVCTPAALSQADASTAAPLGTLAGAPALGEVAAAAGFRTVRRLGIDAPMNLLLELRP